MKKQKIKHLNIFGDKVKIIHDPKLIESGYFGRCVSSEKKIFYSDHESKKELMATLIHEIFHHMCYRIGIRQAGFSHEMEEILSESISRVLVENFEIRFKK